MAILSIRDVNFIKLKSLKKEHLIDFCVHFQFHLQKYTRNDKNILLASDNDQLSTIQINEYIKKIYIQAFA